MSEKTRRRISKINIDGVVKSKNPNLYRVLPRFIIRFIEGIVCQDEINKALDNFGHLYDYEFIRGVLDYLEIDYTIHGKENIPKEGRYTFSSNHPLGGLDGLIFMDIMGRHFPDLKFLVNDILMNLHNIESLFLPINKHGANSREAAILIDQAYASDSQMLVFPAGLVSRKQKGNIADLEWKKTFIARTVRYKRDLIPVYIDGRNSNFFYNLANYRKAVGIKMNIEMLFLAREFFRNKSEHYHICFGKPIPYQTFTDGGTYQYWAKKMREKTYELKNKI